MDPGAKAILTWELNSSGDVHFAWTHLGFMVIK